MQILGDSIAPELVDLVVLGARFQRHRENRAENYYGKIKCAPGSAACPGGHHARAYTERAPLSCRHRLAHLNAISGTTKLLCDAPRPWKTCDAGDLGRSHRMPNGSRCRAHPARLAHPSLSLGVQTNRGAPECRTALFARVERRPS